MSHRLFIERLLITIGIVALSLLLWQLRHLFLLIFGAILVGVIFRIIADPVARRCHVPDGVALLVAVLSVLLIFIGAFGMFGAQAIEQMSSLKEAIPAAWQAVQARLEMVGLAGPVSEWLNRMRSSGGSMLGNIGGIALTIGNGVADLLLVLVGGIYLAAQPKLYKTGIIKLVPEGARGRIAQALDDSWTALRLWLLGRLVSMTVVGLLTGIGLWLIGVPAALALALVAFLLEFIPFIGPILSSVPAILLALAHDPVMALWVAGLYFAVQQAEGYLIEPLVQQRAVSLPPALLLFSLVAGGLVFGWIGLIFAAPLLVVIFVMVKRLYVRQALDTHTELPGEDES